VGFNEMTSLDPGYLNAGLMKPWRGFTPVAAKKNWGMARIRSILTGTSEYGYFSKVINLPEEIN
jgi:hypothetical protein